MNPIQFDLRQYRFSSGFTLIEMAIVLMIIGFLLSGLLVSLTQSAENTRRTNASAQLQRIEEALYGFAQTTGRLPCPASNTSNGLEAGPNASGVCSVPTTIHHGFVPAATLGLTGPVNADGLLLDPWGNPYRYSVADRQGDAASNRAFTSTAQLRILFNGLTGPLTNANMLRVCSEAPCVNTTTDVAPAIILSMGANWGSFTSLQEIANAGNVLVGGYRLTNTDNFVSTSYNENNFDDLIVWLSPNVLFSRMISAGRLP
jgi:prepilin-type N-terminal cleavage/methylation domain-containing protein